MIRVAYGREGVRFERFERGERGERFERVRGVRGVGERSMIILILMSVVTARCEYWAGSLRQMRKG